MTRLSKLFIFLFLLLAFATTQLILISRAQGESKTPQGIEAFVRGSVHLENIRVLTRFGSTGVEVDWRHSQIQGTYSSSLTNNKGQKPLVGKILGQPKCH